MSDKIESTDQNPQTQNLPHSVTAMAETEQSPPQSGTSTTTTPAAGDKYSKAPFSIWPPTERTRDAVRNRLIETLSSASILSKRYGTVSREEAVDLAKIIEEESYEAAEKAASADDDGIEILQVYSKEISKRMLDSVKARSGESADSPATTPVKEAEEDEDEDGGSTAPPQSEKTDSAAGDE